MTVEWFQPPGVVHEWFGQTQGTLATIARGGTTAVASVVGAPGSAGAGASVGPGFKLVGTEIRYDISSLTGA
jgi:hypothetical protein